MISQEHGDRPLRDWDLQPGWEVVAVGNECLSAALLARFVPDPWRWAWRTRTWECVRIAYRGRKRRTLCDRAA